jgi:mono/diheme cytochrome c family protein
MKHVVCAAVLAAVVGIEPHLSGAQSPAPPVPAPPPAARAAVPSQVPVAPRPQPGSPAPAAGAAPASSALALPAQTELVKTYCSSCHSERGRAGGLSLATWDAGKSAEVDHLAVTEKMIRKLRSGMMPPPGARRPEPRQIVEMIEALETRVDRAAALSPNPGYRPFQRLNRAEYARAVKDLVGVDIDVESLLPPDTISHGFDNVADSQTFSATLMESYLRAASRVTSLAIGDPDAPAAEAHYRVPKTANQMTRADGAPLGTRGGISVEHTFPADGDYVFRIDLHSNACGFLFGGPTTGEQIEVSINGERKVLVDIDPRMAENTTGLAVKTSPIRIKAGVQRVTAAFIQRFEGPVNDLVAPIDHTLADTQIGVAMGITTLPHLKDLSIVGPYRVTGVSETASRYKVFTCRPTSAAEEPTCAGDIVRGLATRAFRRTVTEKDFTRLMTFYTDARKEGPFEFAVGAALEAILASPQFLFRLEAAPAVVKPNQPYRITDLDLASRLSYFIWGSGPDETLLKLAAKNQLSAPGVIEKQVARMLADPKSDALSTRFAAQWLRLHDVDGVLPDAVAYPYFDRTLGDAFIKEVELFFDSLVREDRSVLDLITADYSFVNERIAKHYGIPNVTGPQFRRVTVPDERRGLLGKGAIQVLTSVADRTSPVMRGKFVMEVMLGSPPPAPPPNVPPLEATGSSSGGRSLSVRERMEQHRANPACNSCHRVIDPLGLALENFDVTGKYRIKDNGVLVDPKGQLYDGTPMDGPAGLRAALLKHQDVFILSFSESLLTYALGRRVEPYDMSTVRRIIRDAGKKDNKLSAFVTGVAMSPAFTMSKAIAVETATTPAP